MVSVELTILMVLGNRSSSAEFGQFAVMDELDEDVESMIGLWQSQRRIDIGMHHKLRIGTTKSQKIPDST